LSFGAGLASVGGGLAERGGLTGSFFTGALAVVVATPCTAPFMGAALGFALVQPPVQALAVFAALGAGMAAPFLLLSMTPAFGRLLPKPGVWMDRLKQGLAFPMYATAAWLVWVLSLQAGSDAMLAVMIAMVLIGFAAWAHGATQFSEGKWRLAGRGVAAIGVLAALYLLQGLPSGSEPSGSEPARAEGPLAMKVGAVSWEPYAPERLAAARAADRPVLLNVTAAWCITCLVNEKVALSSPRIAEALEGSGVVTLKADWTRRDPGITALLGEFGRNGVPLYALYPARGRAAELLPQILTEADVIAAIGRLAPAS
jgi:thiol:disulfide interchange protein DsbD